MNLGFRTHPMIWILVLFLVFSNGNGETVEIRDALVQFMARLSPGNVARGGNWGWNSSSDPCSQAWTGVKCSKDSTTVQKIVLDGLNMTGELDAASLCTANGLMVLSLNSNGVSGGLSEEISNCRSLTHIYLTGNRLSGSLPGSLSKLGNLKRLYLSDNGFSGQIPDVARISGLMTFRAENNRLSGEIPLFDFTNLVEFNVSNNNLSGAIPDVGGRFNGSSFLGNPGLCGPPLSNACPPPLPPPPPADNKPKGKGSSKKNFLIYSGYVLIGLIVVLLIAFKVMKRRKAKASDKQVVAKRGVVVDRSQDKVSSASSGSRANRSEFSITSAEENGRSSSLVILSTQVVSEMKFEDLLRSPAEVLGRNRHGTLYKVILNEELNLVVKRTRDWEISRDNFKNRIIRIDQAKHSNVLPVVAFYCSRYERLLVYEFQKNGSLSKLLQESQNGEPFHWETRLNVAAKVSTALAFMHESLQQDRIAHGNLKSSNILFSATMEPLVSEYGLEEIQSKDQSFPDTSQEGSHDAFKTDIFTFGILLLELLTGKLVQNNGSELAMWVNSAIREEWTVEVFDKALVSEGASEERMVGLLQVALKCIDSSPARRPKMREVATMVSYIMESDEQSASFDP